jgi:hypothetical protein
MRRPEGRPVKKEPDPERVVKVILWILQSARQAKQTKVG